MSSLSSRTRSAAVGFIEPCLPSPAEKPPSGASWIHEIKHDGYRLMARRDPVGIRLLTRRGNDWADRYPLIVEAVNHLNVRSCLIDGEVVCCDERGLAIFATLRQRRNEARAFLFAFDLLELDGTDMRREPIEVRKATLASILRKSRPGVRLNEHLEHPDGIAVLQHACKMGLEGIVSKRLGSRYRSGRSPDWLKFKNPAAPAVKREAEEDWGRYAAGSNCEDHRIRARIRSDRRDFALDFRSKPFRIRSSSISGAIRGRPKRLLLAFLNDGALELGEHAHHLKHRLAWC